MLSIPPTRQTTPAALQFFSVTADSVVDDVVDDVIDDVTDDVVDAVTRLVEVDTADSNLLGGFEENRMVGRSGFVLDVEYSEIWKNIANIYYFSMKKIKISKLHIIIININYTILSGSAFLELKSACGSWASLFLLMLCKK
jgi:hypothetical protein